MKRILYLLFPVLLMSVAVSCSRDYDDDYMGDVDERLNQAMTAYRNELIGAEHGWMADVNTSEGIYRFYMKFYNDSVTMTSNNMYQDCRVPSTSTYRFKALQRPTIIFDTYSYLAVICDPDDSISGGSSNQGLLTDFEFEVASFENGVFNLVGRTHGAEATFRKATAEEERMGLDADRGLVSVFNQLDEYLAGRYPYIETEYGPMALDLGYRLLSTAYALPDGSAAIESEVTNIVIDYDRSIRPVKPVTVGNVSISELAWNGSGYDAMLVGGGQLPVKLAAKHVLPLNVFLGCEKDKKYNVFFNASQWFDQMADEPFGKLLAGYQKEMASTFKDFTIKQFQVRFETAFNDKTGTYDKFINVVTVFGPPTKSYFAIYSYDITFDENTPGVFTTGSVYFRADSDDPGYNDLLFGYGVGKKLLNSLNYRTFKIDWAGRMEYEGSTFELGGFADAADPTFRVYGVMDKL